ncbi:hypothetical protein [Azospirillum humicireducens]|uniref:hypothetical protein n=1 Tax=Azospirillum humicireducens TaxID=1226968 RepID=UPI0011B21463|nr:hypothetical protein [Azospirillum humicireducens]
MIPAAAPLMRSAVTAADLDGALPLPQAVGRPYRREDLSAALGLGLGLGHTPSGGRAGAHP